MQVRKNLSEICNNFLFQNAKVYAYSAIDRIVYIRIILSTRDKVQEKNSIFAGKQSEGIGWVSPELPGVI